MLETRVSLPMNIKLQHSLVPLIREPENTSENLKLIQNSLLQDWLLRFSIILSRGGLCSLSFINDVVLTFGVKCFLLQASLESNLCYIMNIKHSCYINISGFFLKKTYYSGWKIELFTWMQHFYQYLLSISQYTHLV